MDFFIIFELLIPLIFFNTSGIFEYIIRVTELSQEFPSNQWTVLKYSLNLLFCK